MTSPGWYEDPEGGGWRWWDGSAWGPLHEPAVPDTPSSKGRGFGVIELGIDFRSGWAARLTMALAVAAGCAAVVAATVLLYTLVVGPLPGAAAAILVVPAVPLIGFGQLLTIGILIGRAEERRRAAPGASRWWSGSLSVRDIRGGLPWPALVVAAVLFYGVIIVAFVPWVWGSTDGRLPGVPTEDPAACEHVLNNHGEYRCLTDAEHEREQLAMQRYFTAIIFGFFVAHCTVASGEVLRSRQLADTAG